MSTPSEAEKALQTLLRSLSSGSSRPSREDAELLANALVPNAPKSNRSLAFICLSKISDVYTSEDGSDIAEIFESYVKQCFDLGDKEVSPEHFVPVTCLLGSLFSLSPLPATTLLTIRLNDTEEALDPLSILLESAELPSPLQPALAELFASASSSKKGRELVRSRAEEWLRGAVSYDGDQELGVLCAVALSKLGKEVVPGETPTEEGEQEQLGEEIALCKKMMDHISSATTPTSSLLPTLEGLSVLSTKGPIKHLLVTDAQFLKALVALSPVPQVRPSSLPVTPRASVEIDEKLFEPIETSLCYGLTTILVQLTARKAVLSAEDEQMARLRAMAISGKKGNPEIKEDPFDTDEAVRIRVEVLTRTGVVSALRGLARAQSQLVQESLGRLCLNLVEDKQFRPTFLRDGGFRVLSNLVRDLISPPAKPIQSSTPPDYLPGIQALAKLAITTPPHLLFPPPHMTTSINALSPLYHLLTHPSSTLLQQFEALMALTNLASIGPDIAERMVKANFTPPKIDNMWKGSGRSDTVTIISVIEGLLLDSNTLVRRAATELVCNLVSSPAGFAHVTGDDGSETGIKASGKVKSRLNVLLVLTSVNDIATRLAASGALAILSDSKITCDAILSLPYGDQAESTSKRSPWARILSMLEPDSLVTDEDGEEVPVISSNPPNPDMIHRAVIVIDNLIQYITSLSDGESKQRLMEARKASIEERLLEIIRTQKSREILEPAVETLKTLKKYPA